MLLLLLAIAVGTPTDPCAAAAFLVERTGVSPTDTTPQQTVPPQAVVPFSDDDRNLLPTINTAITQALPSHRCLKDLTDVVQALTAARHRYFQKFGADDDAGLFTVELYDQLLRLPHTTDERARLTFFRAEILWDIGHFRDAEVGYRRVVELAPAGEYATTCAYNRVLAAKAHLEKRGSPNQESRDRRQAERRHPQHPMPEPPHAAVKCATFSGLCLPAVSEPFSADEQLLIDAVDAALNMPLPPPAVLVLTRAPATVDDADVVRAARRMLEERAAVAFDGALLSVKRGQPDARPRLEAALDLASGGVIGRFDLIAAILVDHVVQRDPGALLPLLDRLQADLRGDRIHPILIDARARAQATSPPSTP
jgi:hypothetical protein